MKGVKILKNKKTRWENLYPKFIIEEEGVKYLGSKGSFDYLPHQIEVRKRVREGDSAFLLQHGMGTGKTVSSLLIIAELLGTMRAEMFLRDRARCSSDGVGKTRSNKKGSDRCSSETNCSY